MNDTERIKIMKEVLELFIKVHYEVSGSTQCQCQCWHCVQTREALAKCKWDEDEKKDAMMDNIKSMVANHEQRLEQIEQEQKNTFVHEAERMKDREDTFRRLAELETVARDIFTPNRPGKKQEERYCVTCWNPKYNRTTGGCLDLACYKHSHWQPKPAEPDTMTCPKCGQCVSVYGFDFHICPKPDHIGKATEMVEPDWTKMEVAESEESGCPVIMLGPSYLAHCTRTEDFQKAVRLFAASGRMLAWIKEAGDWLPHNGLWERAQTILKEIEGSDGK